MIADFSLYSKFVLSLCMHEPQKLMIHTIAKYFHETSSQELDITTLSNWECIL